MAEGSIAAVIRERGWGRVSLVGEDGRVCLVGAAAIAAGLRMGDAYDNNDLVILADIIREQYPDFRSHLFGRMEEIASNAKCTWAFNDVSETTEADVLRVAEKADVRIAERV